MRFYKYAMLGMVLLVSLVFSACSGNNAGELFKTAQFEELQNNQEHAVELYREIIKKYPENEFAQKAKERLTEINK